MKKYSSKDCTICKLQYEPTSAPQKICPKCSQAYRSAYKKQWRLNNLERDNANRKKWYWSNLAQVRQYKRNWNNTKGVKYRQKWYAENKELIHSRLKANYLAETNSRISANRIVKKLKWERVCADCGSTKKINIHHKDLNPLNNEVKNLVLLCRVCHTNLHCRIRLERDQNRAHLQTPASNA